MGNSKLNLLMILVRFRIPYLCPLYLPLSIFGKVSTRERIPPSEIDKLASVSIGQQRKHDRLFHVIAAAKSRMRTSRSMLTNWSFRGKGRTGQCTGWMAGTCALVILAIKTKPCSIM